MSICHQSLKRMLSGATLRGTFHSERPNSEHARNANFEVIIERVEKESNLYDWTLDFALPSIAGSKGVACPATVRWIDSVPLISFHQVEWPDVGTIQRAEVILHNGLFAGMWLRNGVRGHVIGVVEPQHQPVVQKQRYLIERTGEALHEWWTGNGWADDSAQARWYEHEPDAPRETADEGAHAVYYPRGEVEPG